MNRSSHVARSSHRRMSACRCAALETNSTSSSSTNMDLLLLAITDQALRWAARSRVSPAVGHLQAWLLRPMLCEKMPGIHDGDSSARLASAAARS